ncbi:MAG: hypothetical protein K0B11_22995 [Mariniphaga sp.]|nr:hypothetical protein [Mariniphaga sp.]
MKNLTAFISVLFLLGSLYAQSQQRPGEQPPPETGEPFKVGMAGYTFVKFDLDKTLETLEKSDVHYLCIKDFHLPFNSTDQQIAESIGYFRGVIAATK